MHTIISFISQRSVFAGILSLWMLATGAAIAATPAAPPPKNLQDLAAWDAYGLGSGTPANLITGNNSFSGKLHLDGVPDDLSPLIIGFKSNNQRLYNLALIYPGNSLVSLLPAVRNTALADIDLPQVVVLLSPPANAGGRVQLPADVGGVRMPIAGGTTITLEAGATLTARGSARGNTAALLQAVGTDPRDITVSGKIDARILRGAGLRTGPLQNELINGIELQVALRRLTLDRKPAYLDFGDSALVLKGEKGNIVPTVQTSMTVHVGGSEARLERVALTRDPDRRMITIAGSGPAPGPSFLTLPVARAAITQMAFQGVIYEQAPARDTFALKGQYVVEGSTPRDFTAVLSGGTPAQYVVTIQTETTLGKLMDWHEPGLDTLVLKNVVVATDYTLADLSLKQLHFTAVLFKGAQQKRFNAALLSDDTFRLPKLLTGLDATPLADLELAKPGLVLVPPENAGHGIKLPEPVVRHVGVETADLTYGLNLIAHANVSGDVATLLAAVGLSPSKLLLTGSLDARFLAAAEGSRTEALLDATTLRAMLPVGPPPSPTFLTFGDSALTLKGEKGKIAAAIVTSLTVHAGSGVRFEDVVITYDPVPRVVTIVGRGGAPGANFLPLPVAGAAITGVVFHGLIDRQAPANNRFTLDGQYVVGGSAPRDFTAVLSGGTPAQYVVTIQTETTLGKLLGWHAPGLDALVLKDVVFGNDYILGNLTLEKLTFTVALFKGAGQAKYNAAFLSDGRFALPRLMPGLQPTPLADLELVRPAFVLAPPENAGRGIRLPDPVVRHVGASTADLADGLNLIAHADAHGAVATLLTSVGLASSNLPITGTVDAAVLAGAQGPLTEALVNATSLQALVPATPQRTPPYLTFGNTRLWVKGASGKFASGLLTSVSVNVGRGIHFDPVTITRDPDKRVVAIEGSGGTPARDFLPLPLAGAAITQVAFHGLIDEQTKANDRYALDGKYQVANSAPRAFAATLSGGTPAQYVATIQTDATLAQLIGWPAPGLDAVALKEVVFGNDYALAHISVRNAPFAAVAFKGAQAKSNLALLSDETFSLAKLMPPLQATPLAELDLARPGLVLVPPENAHTGVRLPDVVAGHVGASSLDLKSGVNVVANGTAHGDLATLLKALGVDPTQLPIVTTLDPAILAGVDVQPVLNALDLHVPLPAFTPPGVARNISVSQGSLVLKGAQKGVDAAVTAKVTVDAGSARPVFQTRFHLVAAATGSVVEVTGTYPDDWKSPFGIAWLDISNVTLSGTLGQTSTLDIVGTTRVGPVHNLTVSLGLTRQSDGSIKPTAKVTGGEVSAADIPQLSSIPHVGDLKLRDLVVSADAIGGTLRSTSLSLLHDVQALAFELGGHWILAAQFGEIDLAKLVALPRFAQPVLGKVKLGKTLLLFSQAGITGRVADLPPAAQAQLQQTYGSSDGTIRTAPGVSLAARFDPSALGPAVTTLLPAGQQLVLQGGVGGVVGGGSPSLALSATIPSVALPPSLAFVTLPSGARTAFVVNLSQTAANAGVEIQTRIGAKLNKQTLNFDSTIAFETDNQGGIAVDLQGTSLDAWRNVMGISGLSLDAGTRLELKTAATSELTLKFFGKTHIGSRTADVAGSASILGGVVDKAAFEVKLSELTLSDVVALFNDAVKAGGGEPVKLDFPDAKLTNVDIAFASPGTNLPELNLPEGGSRLAGDLWFLLKDKPLTRVKGQITETTLALSGDISDFTLGPVAMKGNTLNIRAQTRPALPPEFKITGGATVMRRQVSGEVDSGLAETAYVCSLDLGGLLNLDLHASFDTPAAGLDAHALASQDMALNARLKSDLGGWLRTEGKAVVAKVFDSFGSGIKKLIADVDAAQKKVDDLNGQLKQARARATAGAKTIDQQIAQAQKKVDDLAAKVNSINRDIASEKAAIHGCNYTYSVCYWWNWRGRCTKHKDVPDLKRDAECEADNARHGVYLAGYEAALKSTQAAKAAADGVLASLKKGEKGVDIASLDPEVIALEASLALADVVLEAVKLPAQGAELGVEQLKAGLKALDRVDIFTLKEATISGSLQKAVAGQGILLGLEFEAAGKLQHLRLALKLTDPTYNTKQLETLALLVAKVAVEALPGAAPVVTHLLADAFKAQHDATDKEADQAAKANGLE